MAAYYNEIDAYAAQWLRNLIDSNLIAEGDVDERSIRDVAPDDLVGYTQCHFFAGVGVWSHALRLAGWPDDREVWTGSCPCQPFSAAGQRGGVDDARHLWPDFFRLIGERRPRVVFGEQVASKDGLGWLDIVHADLEGTGYAVGFKDLCAAGVGAPHIRQRLWFVGATLDDAAGARRVGTVERTESPARDETRLRVSGERRSTVALEHAARDGRIEGWPEPSGRGAAARREPDRLAGADGRDASAERQQSGRQQRQQPQDGVAVIVADADDAGPQGRRVGRHGAGERAAGPGGLELQEQPGPVNGVWSDADWLFCRDGKWRPVESGTFPLAHGAPARVGRLRAYGNAIVPQVAAEIIGAFLDARP